MVARAVGNVTVITADHDGSKFTCMTGFACNKHTRHDVSNWYLDCFLSSPAELSDSGKTLTISVDNMELKRFVITGGCFQIPMHTCMQRPKIAQSFTCILRSSRGLFILCICDVMHVCVLLYSD